MEAVFIKILYCLRGFCTRITPSIIPPIATRLNRFRLNLTNPIPNQLVELESADSASNKQPHEKYEYRPAAEVIETLGNNPIPEFRKFGEFSESTDPNLAINLPI